MHTRTRRSHAPKPTPGAICTVSLRGCEPSRMRKKSPHRLRHHTRSASTPTFGRSSARSNCHDMAREASYTSTASSAFGLPVRPLSATRRNENATDRLFRLSSGTTSMNQTALTDFGTRYTAAWSSQNPVSLASFYNEKGSLTVNGGAPSVGRTAITETARGFMTAFPDMVVKMDHPPARCGRAERGVHRHSSAFVPVRRLSPMVVYRPRQG